MVKQTRVYQSKSIEAKAKEGAEAAKREKVKRKAEEALEIIRHFNRLFGPTFPETEFNELVANTRVAELAAQEKVRREAEEARLAKEAQEKTRREEEEARELAYRKAAEEESSGETEEKTRKGTEIVGRKKAQLKPEEARELARKRVEEAKKKLSNISLIRKPYSGK